MPCNKKLKATSWADAKTVRKGEKTFPPMWAPLGFALMRPHGGEGFLSLADRLCIRP